MPEVIHLSMDFILECYKIEMVSSILSSATKISLLFEKVPALWHFGVPSRQPSLSKKKWLY